MQIPVGVQTLKNFDMKMAARDRDSFKVTSDTKTNAVNEQARLQEIRY